MRPEEKAKDLVARFEKALGPHTGAVAAEICVDEILEAMHADWTAEQNLDREYAYWNAAREYIKLL